MMFNPGTFQCALHGQWRMVLHRNVTDTPCHLHPTQMFPDPCVASMVSCTHKIISFFQVCKRGYQGRSCAECDKGFYKNRTGPEECTTCGAGRTTKSTASTSRENCGVFFNHISVFIFSKFINVIKFGSVTRLPTILIFEEPKSFHQEI